MESRESSTGTEQKLAGPWAQRRPGASWATVQCQLHPWHQAPHIASSASKSQSPQWQPLETLAAAAALPKERCGADSQGSGGPS